MADNRYFDMTSNEEVLTIDDAKAFGQFDPLFELLLGHKGSPRGFDPETSGYIVVLLTAGTAFPSEPKHPAFPQHASQLSYK
jgi:hypothetical protein